MLSGNYHTGPLSTFEVVYAGAAGFHYDTKMDQPDNYQQTNIIIFYSISNAE